MTTLQIIKNQLIIDGQYYTMLSMEFDGHYLTLEVEKVVKKI